VSAIAWCLVIVCCVCASSRLVDRATVSAWEGGSELWLWGMSTWPLLLMEEGVFWAKDRRELAAACAATMAQVLNDFLDPQVW